MAKVDVVIVSYNSAGELRGAVEPFLELADVHVIVVDNDSTDGSLETVADLPVTALPAGGNRGFAHGCNLGTSHGSAPSVLFLNPDARIHRASLELLVRTLESDASIGATAPRILGPDGELHHSLRRDARLRSTYARAVFLHRLLPRAHWVDEVIRDPAAYERAHDAEWVSGACVLVRRSALDAVGGFDERFFLYREDMDLCRRLRAAGFRIRYEPAATARHVGGASAPRTALYPVLAVSRILYAGKHRGRVAATLERAGVGLEALTHVAVSQGGRAARKGHVFALLAALAPGRWNRSSQTAR
jgi:GT2 family glycosyltransferase